MQTATELYELEWTQFLFIGVMNMTSDSVPSAPKAVDARILSLPTSKAADQSNVVSRI